MATETDSGIKELRAHAGRCFIARPQISVFDRSLRTTVLGSNRRGGIAQCNLKRLVESTAGLECMQWTYPAKYTDKFGIETTTLMNDSAILSLELRGVRFTGRWFDDFEPDQHTPKELLNRFSISLCGLCECTLETEIPILVVRDGRETAALLCVKLDLGAPNKSGALDRLSLSLTLLLDGTAYRSVGTSGWFEGELLSLQRALPSGAYFKACISCAYSDYSPYGHGLFGGMACFRNFKTEYSRVQDKFDLFPILDKADVVQETYLCPDFRTRPPGTGYRG